MKNPERVAELLAALKAECEYQFEFDAVAKLEQTTGNPPRVIVIDDAHQEFCGKKYAKRKNDEHFFGKNGGKGTTLHREVWKTYYGEIPSEYVIHHVDCNPANNDIENLQLMSRGEHGALHNGNKDYSQSHTFTCQFCGKEFAAHYTGRNKYCSATCATKAYISRNPLQKICAYCGEKFITHKKQTRFCSNACESNARHCKKFALYAGRTLKRTKNNDCIVPARVSKKPFDNDAKINRIDLESTSAGYSTCAVDLQTDQASMSTRRPI